MIQGYTIDECLRSGDFSYTVCRSVNEVNKDLQACSSEGLGFNVSPHSGPAGCGG
jgi:hypothetical protein